MNQPPSNPYSNSARRQTQAADSRYQSPQKPGGRPKPFLQHPSRSEGISNESYSVQRQPISSSLKDSLTVQKQKQNSAPLAQANAIVPQTKAHTFYRGFIRAVVNVITLALLCAMITGGVIAFKQTFTVTTPPGSAAYSTPTNNVIIPTQVVATPGIGIVGHPIQAGVWLVTISHIKVVSDHLVSDANQAYVEISLNLKNTSASPQILASLLEFSLDYTGGPKLYEALTDPDIKQPADGNIVADRTLQAQIAFKVPKSIHKCVLQFEYGLINNSNASVNWSLSI